jgi:hypothetical protein
MKVDIVNLGVPFCVSHVIANLLGTTIQQLLDLPKSTDVFDEENLDYCKSINN